MMRHSTRGKWIIFLISLMGVLFVSGALAEGGNNPITPGLDEIHRVEALINHPESDLMVPKGSGDPVTMKCISKPKLDGAGEWSITTNSSYGKVETISFYLFMKDYSSDYTTVYHYQTDGSVSTFTSCEIITAGSYQAAVYVHYAGMKTNTGYVARDKFTIADDAAHTSLTEKIAEVVENCKASTTWQTALNLHDWLITHAYYDPSVQHYGADIILRGYGVCDAYAKAYCMLCSAAGIPVSRVTGMAGGYHAWNAIQIEGQWYYVDSTWDDPTSGEEIAVSGNERHEYFCLNEELMSVDHTNDGECFTGNCTSLDANYYIHTGKWAQWGERYIWPGGIFHAIPFSEEIEEAFASGNTICELKPTSIWYDRDEAWGWIQVTGRSMGILAYGLSRASFSLDGDKGNQVKVKVSQNGSGYSWTLTVSLLGWDIEETGTLKIPAETTYIDVETFENAKATTLILSNQGMYISDRAFADSAIRTVYIPDAPLVISDTAFEGCARIIFVTNNDDATAYAQEHDILVVSP